MEDFKPIRQLEDFVKWLDCFKFKYDIEESDNTMTFVFHNIFWTYWNENSKELTIHTDDDVGTIYLYLNFNIFTLRDKEDVNCRTYIAFWKDSAIIK